MAHQKSPIPILGPILISTAPLVISILLFYFLGRLLKLEGSIDLQSTFLNFKTLFQTIDFASWQNLIVIYLLLSIAVTMTPSWQDFINMLVPLIFLSAIFYLLVRFVTNFDFIFIKLIPILNLAIFVLILCLLISLVFYTLTRLIFHK